VKALPIGPENGGLLIISPETGPANTTRSTSILFVIVERVKVSIVRDFSHRVELCDEQCTIRNAEFDSSGAGKAADEGIPS